MAPERDPGAEPEGEKVAGRAPEAREQEGRPAEDPPGDGDEPKRPGEGLGFRGLRIGKARHGGEESKGRAVRRDAPGPSRRPV